MVKFSQRRHKSLDIREGTHPPVVELVPLNLFSGRVPLYENGEGGGGSCSQVARRPRHRHLGLGGDVQGGTGLAGTVFVVSDNSDAVHRAWEKTLQRDFFQRSPGRVDHSLPL